MPTKAETETVIQWSLEDDRATVYSLIPRIWKQCIEAGGEEIRLDEGIRDGVKEVRTFLVPVHTVQIRKPRQLTGPGLERAQERARAMGERARGLRARQESDESTKEGHS
jgi:hypothetical protein